MAAAAWSWVEKMLQLAQRTLAPSSTRVSINTAVWMVMCSEPVMRTPCERLLRGILLANGHEAGHFGFGDGDFLASPLGERKVGNFKVGQYWRELRSQGKSSLNLLRCGRGLGGDKSRVDSSAVIIAPFGRDGAGH